MSKSTGTRPSGATRASNARRAAPRPSTRPKNAAPASRVPWLVAALVIVVGLAALIAIFSSGDSDDSAAAGGVQAADVTLTGTPLADADGSGMIDPATDPAVGQTIPVLSGSTPTGEPISFTPTGRPTVYVFVAHWCPHCQAELPRIKTWIDEGRFAAANVVWRTVSTAVDSGAGNYPPSEWFPEIGWTQPVIVDSSAGDAAQAFGLKSFPYMLFVDGNGVVKQRATGELTLPELTEGIQAITG